MNFLLFCLPLWILSPAAAASQSRSRDGISNAVTAEARIESGTVFVSSTSILKPAITHIPAAWELELKRQDPGSITSCVPFQVYESCSLACSLDPRATTCSSNLTPFCSTSQHVYAPGLTSMVLGCATTATASNSHVSPTTSARRTSEASSTIGVSSSAPPSSSAQPSGATGTIGVSSLALPSSSAPPPGATSTSLEPAKGSNFPTDFNAGGIVGGSIGGVAVAALFAFWAYMRRVRRKRQKAEAAASPMTESSSDEISVEKDSSYIAHTSGQRKPDPVA